MTRYLVDTDVVSATSPTIVVKRPELIDWMDLHSSDLFLSAVTIAEIADGIAKPSARVRSGKLPTYQRGCEPCCTSMAIVCCRLT